MFGEKQWTEVAGRLDTWRASLEGVLAVIRTEREKVVKEREREQREADGRVNGAGAGAGAGMGGGRRLREVDMGMDS